MKSYIRILGVVVIVALAAAAVWKGVSRPKVATSPEPTASSSVAATPSVTPLAITYGTAPKDWPTYSSKSLGFSVWYPSGWRMGTCGAGCVAWAPETPASGQFVLGIIKTTNTIASLLKGAEPYIVDKQNVTIGNLTWLKLTLRQPQTGEIVTSHFIGRGTQLYEFGTASTDPVIIAAYGKMLSSFSFLK